MDFRIISIGCLAAHPLWGERANVRSGHSTTTLITSGDRTILVDPGLPAPALAARLHERANLRVGDVTDVFLTTFHPECRRALAAFEDARWWISEEERESVGVALATRLKAIQSGEGIEEGGGHDPALVEAMQQDVGLLRRCSAPEDTLAPHVSVFPMAGITPGASGLLLEGARFTTLICGDAIPTVEHLEQGRVPPAADVDQARASFHEALEVADLFVPGRDNLTVNPTKRPF